MTSWRWPQPITPTITYGAEKCLAVSWVPLALAHCRLRCNAFTATIPVHRMAMHHLLELDILLKDVGIGRDMLVPLALHVQLMGLNISIRSAVTSICMEHVDLFILDFVNISQVMLKNLLSHPLAAMKSLPFLNLWLRGLYILLVCIHCFQPERGHTFAKASRCKWEAYRRTCRKYHGQGSMWVSWTSP